ncbi:MAG: acetate kinase [Gammaproteobacteria bacterium]|uniref:acetate kinase n=1 Tax=Rhodoferax sp. TaxID=50421 RepID=UPI0018126413|nr:acetate kinase [Rhodoferax sp.]MBU3898080.1 acetate kinase [Gammaproteobacteria bacterium]MBA3056395.1 acetate kinase [Rhodoferax sp.]MBU3999163.1 acetate kinase [Gammaproteobacteria bacterium]MBU4081726.1 acetate kinase [Gammaproteobacteria bacterium]MBU4114618.1 acetate kinase [Gammaproteobacteria bacterium]
MAHLKLPAISAVTYAVALLLGGTAQAQSQADTGPQLHAMQARLESLSQDLAEQKRLLQNLEAFRQQYFEQRGLLLSLQRQVAQQQLALDELRGAASWDVLASQRGAGTQGQPGQPELMAQAAVKTKEEVPVGRQPDTQGRPPEVAPLFEQPGVLTPKGRYVLEPSLQYGYSSSNRVALVGYTVIPALLIGLIDVREVKRNTVTAALSARYGLTNRFELEVRAPYVYRSDSTVSRENIAGATENVFSTSGMGMGDFEVGARYQLNDGGIDRPFYIGTLRLKSRTGTDPFEVVTDCAQRCIGTNTTGTGLPLDLPTGSGFYSMQAGLTLLYPSDPAVFFGSVTYLHNFARDNVSRTVLNGEKEFLGTISPGAVLGFNFGMGLALNEKSSFSLGYDHSSVGRTKTNGQVVPGSVRTQLGTLLLGYSYRFSKNTSLSVSVGAGLTTDTPDVSLTVRLPMTF